MLARRSNAAPRSLRASRLAWLPLALAALAPSLAGCEIPLAMMLADDASNDDVAYGDYYDGEYGGTQSALQVKNASVSGDLGEVRGFSAAADTVDAWDDGYYTSITLWAKRSSGSSSWATMTALNIEGGGIQSDVFKPGAKLHFSSDDYGATPYVSAWGCAGAGSDAELLDYEVNGSETDIEVTESDEPGMVHLLVKIRYPGYGSDDQVVEGELDIVVPE